MILLDRTAELPIQDRIHWFMPNVVWRCPIAAVLVDANARRYLPVVTTAQRNLGIRWGIDLTRDLLDANSQQLGWLRLRAQVGLVKGGTVAVLRCCTAVNYLWSFFHASIYSAFSSIVFPRSVRCSDLYPSSCNICLTLSILPSMHSR